MKKKILLLALAVGTAAVFTGCGDKGGYKEYSKYVELGDYKNLTVDRVTTTITDEDVQAEIESQLYSEAVLNEVTDRVSKTGDTVNIDYTGTIDGEEFEGGSETDCEVEIGSESFIADFENQLVDMKTGETKEITLTFPDPYDGELDGKEAVFTVTMNAIYVAELPEYNDAYVKENMGYNTTGDYEAALKDELQLSSDEDAISTACYDAIYLIMEQSTIDGYPDALYEKCKLELEQSNADTAEMFGMTVEELFGEDYDLDSAALDTVNERLITYAIADQEKLTVSDEEYDTYIADNLELYGYETKEEFESDYDPESTRYELLYGKVLDFLAENLTFNDVSEEEYYGEEVDFGEEDMESLDQEDMELLEEGMDLLEQENSDLPVEEESETES